MRGCWSVVVVSDHPWVLKLRDMSAVFNTLANSCSLPYLSEPVSTRHYETYISLTPLFCDLSRPVLVILRSEPGQEWKALRRLATPVDPCTYVCCM